MPGANSRHFYSQATLEAQHSCSTQFSVQSSLNAVIFSIMTPTLSAFSILATSLRDLTALDCGARSE